MVYQADCRECDWRSDFSESWEQVNNLALGHEVGMKHDVRVNELSEQSPEMTP